MKKALTLSAAALGILAVAAVIAGCGGSGSSSASGSTSTASSSGGGEPANSEETGGVLCATSLTNVGLVGEFVKSYKQVAQKYGMEFTEKIANPEGDLASAQSNIQSCTTAGAKIIAGIATENTAVSSLIRRASESGIAYIGDYAGEVTPGVALNIAPADEEMSKQLAEYAKESLEEAGHPLNVMTLGESALPVVVRRISSFEKDAEEAGWNIAESAELDITNVAGSATQKVAAALRSHPEIDVIVSPFDAPTAGAEAAIKQTGDSNVKILSYEGLEPTFAQMRSGKSPIAAIAGAPVEVFNDVRLWAVGQILQGKLPEGTEASCIGPLITNSNIPKPEETIQGGSCEIGGKPYSSAQLEKMAAE
jgi:ABC-type sugar transport system substrate-binding protein